MLIKQKRLFFQTKDSKLYTLQQNWVKKLEPKSLNVDTVELFSIQGLISKAILMKLLLMRGVELGLFVTFLTMLEGKYLIKPTNFMSGLILTIGISYIINLTQKEDWT